MAKAFRFSLQKVLEVRRHKENQKAIELGQARHDLFREKDKLIRLEDEKNSFFSTIGNEENGNMKVTALQINESYLTDLNEKIKHQHVSISEKEQVVEDKRQELLQVSKEKKIVEKLKDKQWESHKKDIRRQLTKFEDEVAIRVTQKGNIDHA